MIRNGVHHRVLSPLERFSEIVFGLIMVLTFTGALSVAEAGREDIRTMAIGAIGCNLAWGIIDAAFYLIGCITEGNRNAQLIRRIQNEPPANALEIIAGALPAKVAEVLRTEELERVREHVRGIPAPPDRPKLTAENWIGALGVFLLVFFSTLPVVLPFAFIDSASLALRASNAVAIALLFFAGRKLAVYAGLPPVRTGLLTVAVGAVLVAITIALGG